MPDDSAYAGLEGVVDIAAENGTVHVWGYDEDGDSPAVLTPPQARRLAQDLWELAAVAEGQAG